MSKVKKAHGRPPFEATEFQRRMVMIMRSSGVSVDLIASNVGVAEMTWRKHFPAELATGHEQVKAGLGAVIVSAGLNGNINAAKYWLSTHGGPEWRVTEAREIGGIPGGQPLQMDVKSKVVLYLPDNGRGDAEPTED